MKLLFAFYNVEFAKQLKGNMEVDGQAQIIDIVSTEEDLIGVIAKNPTMDGVLISTDIATKLGNKNLELFVDTLLAAREKFPDVIFSVLSSERMGHPIHAELVDMGIYNIFVKDSSNLSVPLLLHSFKEPISFSSAIKHRKVNDSIPWRRSFNRQTTIRVEIGDDTPGVENEEQVTEDLVNESPTPKKRIAWPEIQPRKPREPKGRKESTNDGDKEWFDIENVTTTSTPKSRVIGTVVIALGSVAPHLGTTHTALSMASSLKEKGNVVAVVEGNSSQDFERIHSLYEGETTPLSSVKKFVINGVDHYKYQGDEFMQELFAIYEFLILDLGDLDLEEYEMEFRRAHVRGVLCSGHEWKFHWIEDFRRKYFSEEDIYYMIPHGTPSVVKDLQERLPDLQVVPIPTHEDPYKPSKEAMEFTDELLSPFLSGFTKSFSKTSLVVTSLVSVVLTSIVIAAFLLI